MRGFGDFSMDEYLAADRGIIVYLESTDDVFVFRKWFDKLLSKIQFKSISDEKANGGCGVIIKFFEDNPDLSFAYGVVDRDVLLRNINSTRYPDCSNQWWNTDDDDFHSNHPFGDKIFVLHRWELENYLLHPEALQKLLYNKTRGKTSLTTADEVAKKIIDNESDLVAVTLFSTLDKGSIGSMRYGQDKTGDDLWSMVDELGQSEEERDEHKSKITSFAEDKDDPMERWDRLSRMLDGKRTMYRLDNILHSNPRKFCLEREFGALADHIANLGLIDPALKSWLHQVSN
jgi:hypothetical protein